MASIRGKYKTLSLLSSSVDGFLKQITEALHNRLINSTMLILRTSVHQKIPTEKMKIQQAKNWEKVFATVTDKELVSRIYKEL